MTASQDASVRLWDVKTGQCTQILTGHSEEVFSAVFSYDGEYLITCGKDNCVGLYNACNN